MFLERVLVKVHDIDWDTEKDDGTCPPATELNLPSSAEIEINPNDVEELFFLDDEPTKKEVTEDQLVDMAVNELTEKHSYCIFGVGKVEVVISARLNTQGFCDYVLAVDATAVATDDDLKKLEAIRDSEYPAGTIMSFQAFNVL